MSLTGCAPSLQNRLHCHCMLWARAHAELESADPVGSLPHLKAQGVHPISFRQGHQDPPSQPISPRFPSPSETAIRAPLRRSCNPPDRGVERPSSRRQRALCRPWRCVLGKALVACILTLTPCLLVGITGAPNPAKPCETASLFHIECLASTHRGSARLPAKCPQPPLGKLPRAT
jgi:hypothetical protein